MSELVLIDRALCLSAVDIAALLRGQLIAVISRVSVQKGWIFALYPYLDPEQDLALDQVYRSPALPLAQATIAQQERPIAIEAWAKCEQLKMLHEVEQVEALSNLTIWTKDWLKRTLEQRQHLFLAFLRVYRLPEPVEISHNAITPEKFGKFVGFSAFGEQFPSSLKMSATSPVLSPVTFEQRKQQLSELRPPLHPELEELQSAIAPLALSDPAAKEFDRKIRTFLGWTHDNITPPNPDLGWIKTINELGDRSKEQDDGKKSNYQAGTDFENVVRRGLEFLGFTVDEAHKGGAGGLDLFCSKPYALAGECKAGKSIPVRAVEELERISKRRLRERYESAVRLIIGSGKPTKDLQESSKTSKVSIINSMTFEKLVELHAKYPNSVDLIKLKEYLQPGQVDPQIEKYIDKVLKGIRTRSHIVRLLKNKAPEKLKLEYLHGAYENSNPPQPLNDQEFRDILIELSSPLTGYLGRHKGDGWQSDRFYYLRDLSVN